MTIKDLRKVIHARMPICLRDTNGVVHRAADFDNIEPYFNDFVVSELYPGRYPGKNNLGIIITLRTVWYECDPEKNTTCKKHSCQNTCYITHYVEHAKKDENGTPVIAVRESLLLQGQSPLKESFEQ